MTSCTCLAFILVIVATLVPTKGCTCPAVTIEKFYCMPHIKNSFKARVISEAFSCNGLKCNPSEKQPDPFTDVLAVYQLRVLRVFKGDIETGSVVTGSTSLRVCPARVSVRNVYLFNTADALDRPGKFPAQFFGFSFCPKPPDLWGNVPRDQRRFLRKNAKKNGALCLKLTSSM